MNNSLLYHVGKRPSWVNQKKKMVLFIKVVSVIAFMRLFLLVKRIIVECVNYCNFQVTIKHDL